MTPSKALSSLLLLIVFAGSWIDPIWPVEQAMQSALTVVACFALWLLDRHYPLPEKEFFLIVLFLATHTIAARWLYSNIPYDHWVQSLTGISIDRLMGWHRNNFDRFVHFLYGVCITPAIVSICTTVYHRRLQTGFCVALIAVMVTSLWYEWFEWLLAMTLSEKAAEAFNGQQGDIWDPHKDMLLASFGSSLWALRFLVRQPDGSSPFDQSPLDKEAAFDGDEKENRQKVKDADYGKHEGEHER